jgi:hypothetical protein
MLCPYGDVAAIIAASTHVAARSRSITAADRGLSALDLLWSIDTESAAFKAQVETVKRLNAETCRLAAMTPEQQEASIAASYASTRQQCARLARRMERRSAAFERASAALAASDAQRLVPVRQPVAARP